MPSTIEASGTVARIDGDYAIVNMDQTGCGRCHEEGGCGGNNLGNLLTPVRRCFNYAEDHFLGDLPDVYVQVVMSYDDTGSLIHTGVFVGDDLDTYLDAAKLSREQNITVFDEPVDKIVAVMQADEFRATWVANKAVYPTVNERATCDHKRDGFAAVPAGVKLLACLAVVVQPAGVVHGDILAGRGFSAVADDDVFELQAARGGYGGHGEPRVMTGWEKKLRRQLP